MVDTRETLDVDAARRRPGDDAGNQAFGVRQVEADRRPARAHQFGAAGRATAKPQRSRIGAQIARQCQPQEPVAEGVQVAIALACERSRAGTLGIVENSMGTPQRRGARAFRLGEDDIGVVAAL